MTGVYEAAHKKDFLELLESDNEEVERFAWEDAPYLIEDGVISREEAAAYKAAYKESFL